MHVVAFHFAKSLIDVKSMLEWLYIRDLWIAMKMNFNVFIRIAFVIVIVYFMFNVVRIIYDVNEAEKEIPAQTNAETAVTSQVNVSNAPAREHDAGFIEGWDDDDDLDSLFDMLKKR